MADFLSFLLLACWRGVFLPRADVVMALTTPPLVSVLGAILSLLWRARFVCWLMDLNPDEAVAVGWLDRDGPVTDFLETALRWSLERAERVIVPDIYMRGRLLGKGVPAEKMEVIPLWVQGGVIFDAAGRERFRREHGLEGKYVVMYAGNHTPCHPLDTLMSAARLLRDEARIHFCFIGGGMGERDVSRLPAGSGAVGAALGGGCAGGGDGRGVRGDRAPVQGLQFSRGGTAFHFDRAGAESYRRPDSGGRSGSRVGVAGSRAKPRAGGGVAAEGMRQGIPGVARERADGVVGGGVGAEENGVCFGGGKQV